MHLIALFLTLFSRSTFCVQKGITCSCRLQFFFFEKKSHWQQSTPKKFSSIGRMAFRKNFNRFLPDTPDAFAIMKIMINYRIYGAAVCVWLDGSDLAAHSLHVKRFFLGR